MYDLKEGDLFMLGEKDGWNVIYKVHNDYMVCVLSNIKPIGVKYPINYLMYVEERLIKKL